MPGIYPNQELKIKTITNGFLIIYYENHTEKERYCANLEELNHYIKEQLTYVDLS